MKIQFFYTTGHSFTANNVVVYGESDMKRDTLVYQTRTFKGDISTIAEHEVPLFDLLYAVITGEFSDDGRGTTTIIHGTATKFDVQVQAAQLAKIVGEAHDEANAEEASKNFKAKEEKKFRLRQKKRFEDKMLSDERSEEVRLSDEFNKSANDAVGLVKKVGKAAHK